MKQQLGYILILVLWGGVAFAQGDAIPVTEEEKKAIYEAVKNDTESPLPYTDSGESSSNESAPSNLQPDTNTDGNDDLEQYNNTDEEVVLPPQPSRPSNVSGVMDYVDDIFLDDTTGYNIGGQISILGDPRIDHLIHIHTKERGKVAKVPGYRIQIIQDTKRETIKNEKMRLISMYGNVPTYQSYQAPFFKLRIGNYTDRFEAYRMYLELKPIFPRAFIVRDKVRP